MNANYYLKVNKDKTKHAIRLHCTFDGIIFRYPVGKCVDPDYWDNDKQKVKKGVEDFELINEHLEKVRSAAMNEFYKHKNEGKVLTVDYLKNFLVERFRSENNTTEYIDEYFQKYIEDKFNRVGEKRQAKYKTLYKHLLDIQKHYKRKITFTDLNEKFYFQFIDYFIFELGHVNRSVKESHLKVLSSFINWSVNKGYIQKNPYKGIKFPYKISPADTVSLSDTELNTLCKLDLSDKRLDRIRDSFCLECFLGFRYSDMDKILPENLKGNHLEIYTQKTLDKLSIPLLPQAIAIIKKYFDNGEKFPSISNQKSNEYIKELCEIAKINESISILKISGLKRITEVYEKYKLVSTHTARRTFVTLSSQRGMNPFDIMKITGHKDLKTLQEYYRLDQAKVSENFFKAHATIKPAYTINEIIANLVKLKVDSKVIAEAFGIDIENIP